MAGVNKIPTSLEEIGTFTLNGKPVRVNVTNVWYLFFSSLSALLNNLVGGVLGFTLDNAVVAAGATQITAPALTTEWAVVTTVPLNSGIRINSFGPGAASTVFNQGANPLKVYPPVGGKIDALAINAAYTLAVGKQQTFSQIDVAKWLSTQLG